MRRLLVLASVVIVGLLVYRQRTIDRWERTLDVDGDSGSAAGR